MTQPSDSKFDDLLQAWLDGTAHEHEKVELVELIKSNPDLEAEFLKKCKLDAQLKTHFQSDLLDQSLKERLNITLIEPKQEQALKENIFETIKKRERSPTLMQTIVKFAALLFICLILVLLLNPKSENPTLLKIYNQEGMVQVIRDQKAIPSELGSILMTGDSIKTNQDSKISLMYQDNTRLTLYKNSELKIISSENGKQLFLTKGKLKSEVVTQPKGSPFIVKTKHSEITVLGTIFEVHAHIATQLNVIKGKVQIQDLKTSKTHILTNHQTIQSGSDATFQISHLPSFLQSTSHREKRIVYIDFGAEEHQTPNWNNIFKDTSKKDLFFNKLVTTNTYLSNLVDHEQNPTSINLNMSEFINWKNTTGAPNKDLAFLPDSVQIDSIWGGEIEKSNKKYSYNTIELKLEGFAPKSEIALSFYANVQIKNDNVETEVQIIGNSETRLYLNPGQSPELLTTEPFKVNNEGKVTIFIRKGPNNTHPYGHFFIGCMIIQMLE